MEKENKRHVFLPNLFLFFYSLSFSSVCLVSVFLCFYIHWLFCPLKFTDPYKCIEIVVEPKWTAKEGKINIKSDRELRREKMLRNITNFCNTICSWWTFDILHAFFECSCVSVTWFSMEFQFYGQCKWLHIRASQSVLDVCSVHIPNCTWIE